MIDALIAVATANLPLTLGVGLGAWYLSGRAKSMAAAGFLGQRMKWLARIPVVGVVLAVGLVVLLANRRTRRATVTGLMIVGVIVFAGIVWLAPGLALQLLFPIVLSAGLYACWPGSVVARALDGQPINRANISAARERARQQRLLAEAVRRSASGLPVLGVDLGAGTATVRVGVPAGQSPHALDTAGDTITNAVNVLAAEQGADLHAVATRIGRGADGVTIDIDTQPRRLPQRVEWPGAQQ